jgi:hypothetical protein
MSDPKRIAQKSASSEAEVFRLANGVMITLSRTEAFTTHHQSISEELMTATTQVAHSRFAVPAVEQTKQVRSIGLVFVLVFAMATYGLTKNPDSGWAIAEMVSVMGAVFGGIYIVSEVKRRRAKDSVPESLDRSKAE